MRNFRQTGNKRDINTRSDVDGIFRSLVTFVAIDLQGRSVPVPPMQPGRLDSEMVERVATRKQLTANLMAKEAEVEALAAAGGLTWADVEEPWNRTTREKLAGDETELHMRRMFMPRNLNTNGSVFGGDLIEWMESSAVHCAKHFTRNSHIATVSMQQILFLQPVFPGDLVECITSVIYTSVYTVHVRAEVRIQRGLAGSSDRFAAGSSSGGGGGGSDSDSDGVISHSDGVISHTGHFVVANFDRAGRIHPLLTGLDTAQDDGVAGGDTALAKYALAQARQRFIKENRSAGFFAR